MLSLVTFYFISDRKDFNATLVWNITKALNEVCYNIAQRCRKVCDLPVPYAPWNTNKSPGYIIDTYFKTRSWHWELTCAN